MKNITRENIVLAAYDLYKYKSLKSVTIDELVTHLNMSKRTLYRYFNGSIPNFV